MLYFKKASVFFNRKFANYYSSNMRPKHLNNKEINKNALLKP
jgi:hypothetical protein